MNVRGQVKQTVYPQIPPKVQNELTELGRSLLSHLHQLVSWANSNLDEIKKSRETFELAAGRN